jgi:hypothetical protein
VDGPQRFLSCSVCCWHAATQQACWALHFVLATQCFQRPLLHTSVTATQTWPAGKHRVAYDGQQGGGDAWLALAGARFQWLGGPRAGQAPNPTFAALPPKDELVGARVKVFWPGMGR